MTKTLVSNDTLSAVLDHLDKCEVLAFDTETTGLSSFQGAKMFSLAICDEKLNAYYFNFQTYTTGLDPKFLLTPLSVKELMVKPRKWVAQNAKFDLHMVAKTCTEMHGEFEDTKTLGRIYENHHQFTGGYSLDALAKRYLPATEKSDAVKKWMDENNAFSTTVGADGRTVKNLHFNLVPFDIISDYAMQDTIATMELYHFFKKNTYEGAAKVVELESKLIPILYRMEKIGLHLDQSYVEKAYAHEQHKVLKIRQELTAVYPDFVDSAQFVGPLLKAEGAILPQTEKGNDQINDKALSCLKGSFLADKLLELRDAVKRSQTYWYNYSTLTDPTFTIHPSYLSDGTATGRMSCAHPNLQNIPAEDGGDFPVRRAFIARPGFKFVAIDYSQMEFRLMLEYAKQMDLIEKIKEGLDPHDATAQLTGLSRKAAKTLNFGLLYGMGVAKLGDAIGVDADSARKFKYEYFGALPGVKRFINDASRAQEAKGFTMDLYGRRFYLEGWPAEKKWSYKAANSIIQGGCADIVKSAMVALDGYLADKKSRMVLQVHDEIVFEVSDDEVAIIFDLKKIMEQAYQARHMPMKCSMEVGDNLHDLKPVNT